MATAGGSRVSSVFRPALFKGKTAIVTGGATGIGSAITKELLYLGIWCFLIDGENFTASKKSLTRLCKQWCSL